MKHEGGASRESVAGTVERLFRAINRHDVGGVGRVIAADCTFRDASAAEPYDRAGFLEMHREYYEHFPDVAWEILHRIIWSDGACYLYRCTGTGKGEWPEGTVIEGKAHDMTEAMIAQVADGVIRDVAFLIDSEELAGQPWSAPRSGKEER